MLVKFLEKGTLVLNLSLICLLVLIGFTNMTETDFRSAAALGQNAGFADPNDLTANAAGHNCQGGDRNCRYHQSIDLAYPGLNETYDGLRVVVGGLPQTWEFPFLEAGRNFGTAALVGAVVTPAGHYSGQTANWPDLGVAGYALTYSKGKTAVASFAHGGIGSAGSSAFAFNGVVANCELGRGSCTVNGGFNFTDLVASEKDINIWTLPSGDGPQGGVIGDTVTLQANAQAMSHVRAVGYTVRSTGEGRWVVGYATENGSAVVGQSIGAQNRAAPSDSQIIYINAISEQNKPIHATLQFSLDGSMHLGMPKSLVVDSAGLTLTSGTLRQPLWTPRSSNSSCETGQFADDTEFHYVCVARNTWKRIALSDF